MYSHSNPQLDFVAAPALRPAEVEIDAAQQAIYEKELEAAAAAPLPDEVSLGCTHTSRRTATDARFSFDAG